MFCVIFSFIVTSLYCLCYVSQDFCRSTQVSAIAKEKTSDMTRLGAGKCVLISVIAGVCFVHFFVRFAMELALVRNIEVSVRRESTVLLLI